MTDLPPFPGSPPDDSEHDIDLAEFAVDFPCKPESSPSTYSFAMVRDGQTIMIPVIGTYRSMITFTVVDGAITELILS
ncbi:hypothetical protein REA38_11570 [Serratia sp. MF2]|uniref:hypothetical protein n=1 Tax=Serratia sp. MF1(2023) TaxID=3059171 RepID=UPI0027F78B19|nr:hypothetical protein [Serratia sp. MF1(2023)]MDQ7104188.1 hypothetical protein [Serratia sp. MF1(2023)]